MELTLNPKAVEIIDEYMDSRKPTTTGLERICMNELWSMAQKVFYEKCNILHIHLKGEKRIENEFDRKYRGYFTNYSWYQYTYQWSKRGYGYRYFLLGKCERYFESNSDRFIFNFLSETYRDIETAVLNTDCFMKLVDSFQNWFDERRNKFMEKMEVDIQKVKEVSQKKTPQSHGGVANLLKVLTKTMEKQGADIQNIAKVQYAVCVQAGIYIPDEFIRDVAATLDMKEIEQLKETEV